MVSTVEPAPNSAQQESFACWMTVLGDENIASRVFLKAWASHTSGELLLYPDDAMVHPLARFPLGRVDSSIIVTEDVITLQFHDDRCSFQCDSKKQQMKWLKIMRYPLLSPLIVNNSKGWQWDDDVCENQKKISKNEADPNSHQNHLKELAANRQKSKEKEIRDVRIAKEKKEYNNKNVLKNHKERLVNAGREDEFNWTKETKNMYKTLGVEQPASSLTPSQYTLELRRKEDYSTRLNNSRIAAKENVDIQGISRNNSIYSSQKSVLEEDSIASLSQCSETVREYLDSLPIKYKNALSYAKSGEEQLRACIKIQKLWRAFACRNIHLKLYKHYAAISIQIFWKLYKRKQTMKRNMQLLLSHRKEEQKFYRLQEQRRRKTEIFAAKQKKKSREKARLACIIIQSAFRQYLYRKRMKNVGVSSEEDLEELKDRAESRKVSSTDGESPKTSSLKPKKKRKKKKRKTYSAPTRIEDSALQFEDFTGMVNKELSEDPDIDEGLKQKNVSEDGPISSAIPRFQEAVRKVIVQQHVIYDIFNIDDNREGFSDEIIARQPKPPPKTRQPSYTNLSSSRGMSFRRLLSS